MRRDDAKKTELMRDLARAMEMRSDDGGRFWFCQGSCFEKSLGMGGSRLQSIYWRFSRTKPRHVNREAEVLDVSKLRLEFGYDSVDFDIFTGTESYFLVEMNLKVVCGGQDRGAVKYPASKSWKKSMY